MIAAQGRETFSSRDVPFGDRVRLIWWIVNRHYRFLLKDDGADVTQDVELCNLELLRVFPSRVEFRPFLNAVNRWFRRRVFAYGWRESPKSRREQGYFYRPDVVRLDDMDDGELHSGLLDPHLRWEDDIDVDSPEEARILRESVCALPALEFYVVIMRYFCGFKFGDVGKRLGLSYKVCWKADSSARERLRFLLGCAGVLRSGGGRRESHAEKCRRYRLRKARECGC